MHILPPRAFQRLCGVVMLAQMAVGAVRFTLHALADWRNVGDSLFLRIVHGAPIFAPTLFYDLAVLAGIGLWVLDRQIVRGNGPHRC